MNKKSIQFGYKHFIKPVGIKNIYIPAVGLLGSIAGIINIYFPGAIINRLYPNSEVRAAAILVTVFCVSTLAVSSLNTFFMRKMDYESLKVTTSVKKQLVSRQLSLNLLTMESPEYADDFSFGSKCLDRNFYSVISGVIISVISLVLLLIGSVTIIREKKIVCLYIVGSLLLLPASYVAQNMINKNKYSEQVADNSERREMETLQWNMLDLQYGQEVRAFGLRKFLAGKYNYCRNYVYDAMKVCCKKNAVWAIIPAVIFGTQLIAAYLLTMNQYTRGEIEVGDFVMYVAAFTGVANAIMQIADEAVRIKAEGRYFGALQKCFTYDTESEGERLERQTGELSFKTLEFKDVSFSYGGDDTYALKNINLNIHEGERIAIVGENGSGKTTFIKLLTGLYKPTKGAVLINGKDISLFGKDEISRLISPVFQDYALTYYTIRENIAFADEIDEERMEAVLKEVGLDQKIETLNKGIDTHVFYKLDNEGTEMSGGELQKVAIARALYKDSPILILDEPTAALSPKAERELYHRIWEFKDQRTIFLISHRLSSCVEAEKIVVLKDGEITELGTHAELTEAKGYYNSLFSAQAKNYKD